MKYKEHRSANADMDARFRFIRSTLPRFQHYSEAEAIVLSSCDHLPKSGWDRLDFDLYHPKWQLNAGNKTYQKNISGARALGEDRLISRNGYTRPHPLLN